MTDHTFIYLCGVYCLGFAVFHLRFSRLFNWTEELEKVSPVNKAIMYIFNQRLIYLFVFIAVMCFAFTEELATSRLGNFFLIGMSLFWLGRTIEQFVYVRIDHPLNHLLRYVFLLGAILFAIPVVM